MKTMTKKMGAIVLALALCLSLCCTALAADSGTYTITVDPAYTGETYEAYKVFDATYSGSGEDLNVSYTIDSLSPWYNQVAEATDVFTLSQVGKSTTYVVTAATDPLSSEEIVKALSPVPEGAVAVATVVVPASTSGVSEATTATLDVSSGDAGYYYVTTSLGSAVAIDTTTPNATVGDKNTPPELDKQVDNGEEDIIDNHKTVTYSFDITNVKGIHSLVLEDEMEISLDDEGNPVVKYEFDYESLEVGLYEDETLVRGLVEGTDYTLVTDPGDGCDFHIEFEDEFDDCTTATHIYVTIKCELDAGENGFEEDEITIPNRALVTYGNGGKTAWDEVYVYEYGFDIYKFDGEDETPLAGAHFSLTNEDGETAYFTADLVNNTYVLEGWGEPTSEAYTSDLVSDGTGYIKIEGLGEGTFTITETIAPDGYNLLTDSIVITIIANGEDLSKFTVTSNDAEITGHTVSIENNAGTILPSTGGIGTTIFYIIGGVLVVGAVVVLVTRRRMTREG